LAAPAAGYFLADAGNNAASLHAQVIAGSARLEASEAFASGGIEQGIGTYRTIDWPSQAVLE
jgi:hypothetical protein